jgi:hypothetical protein
MAKRTRLKKGNVNNKKNRLAKELRVSVTQMSNKQLQRLVETPVETRKVDPILNQLVLSAKDEVKRRQELAKVMGEVPPVVPKRGIVQIAKEVAEPFEKIARTYAQFFIDTLKGKLADDIVKGTDYIIEQAEELYKRGIDAKKRWEATLKAHKILKKTETDYLREGYDLKSRLRYDMDHNLLKGQVALQKAKFKNVILIPVKVNGNRFYSLMVK